METQQDIRDIGFFDAKKLKFTANEGGFLELEYNGTKYPRVAVRRVLPHKLPEEYLSVCDHELKELGIIKSLSELSTEQAELIRNELSHRYYCPILESVESLKDKMGYIYIEAKLMGKVRYDKSFAVKDVSKNIRRLSEDEVIIFDVDGNRYLIKAFTKLDQKSIRMLEPYVF